MSSARSEMPSSENSQKARTDELASELLGLDAKKLVREAGLMATFLKSNVKADPLKIVVTGAAGSGKTTLANALSSALGLPVFDMDQFVDGGWTPNRPEYDHRLIRAMYKLLAKMPSHGGWVVEHVEACHPSLVHSFEPNVAVILHTDKRNLLRVAEARSQVSRNGYHSFAMRALGSGEIAERQFREVPGKEVRGSSRYSVKVIGG